MKAGKLRVLDLFSGIGGFSLGLVLTGRFETAAFCEPDPFCQKVLRKHWPEVRIINDVRGLYRFATDCVPCPDCEEPFCELCGLHFWECFCIGASEFDDEIGAIDVICGGYPCQPYSQAGLKRGAEDDRDLWPEMRRAIDRIGPRFILGENVAHHAALGLDEVLSDLETRGYQWQAFIVPACAVDAPHIRERVWFLADAEGGRLSNTLHTGTERGAPPGIPEGLRSASGRRWPPESGLDRVAHGLPGRVDRCRALGNAVVPAVVSIFGAVIAEIVDAEQQLHEASA